MTTDTELLKALPVAVYATDRDGRITFYNQAAAELWGHSPKLGTAQWCGSWRLFWPGGEPLAHDQCPMAIMLKEGRAMPGVEAVAERPDGSRVHFAAYPRLLRDEAGQVTGAVNVLVNVAERRDTELESARLAAIVASSDDAIISKTLDGIITSWNRGATSIFGYDADEMVGQSILRLIPADLRSEETEIIAKLRRGEHIDHYDTVRLAKGGRRVQVSLTVSPLHDGTGRIVGASKVARDVTERKSNEELQRLLLEELNHRVKNTLATVQAIAAQSLRHSDDPAHFVRSFNGRVQALARAHDLLVRHKMHGSSMAEVIREQVLLDSPDDGRIAWCGTDVVLTAKDSVQLGLVLHELATNARKYGALSGPNGRLSINWRVDSHRLPKLVVEWQESGVEGLVAPTAQGFGTKLIERTLAGNGGDAALRYERDGLVCVINLPLEVAAASALNPAPERAMI